MMEINFVMVGDTQLKVWFTHVIVVHVSGFSKVLEKAFKKKKDINKKANGLTQKFSLMMKHQVVTRMSSAL